MKVLLYSGGLKIVERSGVGKAVYHQQEALRRAGIDCVLGKTAAGAAEGENCDIVQFNTIFPDSYIKSRIAKLRGKRVVYYGHSTMEDFRNSFKGSNLLAPLFKRWIKCCYETGDVIITPTEYSKSLLTSYGIEKPIVSLTNGIDLSGYRRDPAGRQRFREKYGLADDEKVVISVGHFIERKGIVEFVETAKRFPQYTFIWFGYTNPKLIPEEVRTAVKTDLPNLIFAGYVDKDTLKDAYSGSDLFLFLTKEETEGIVVLEAMAMELPILIRDIPIYREWLPEGQVVYKGRTQEEFEQVLPRLLEGALPDLTANALRLVKQNDISKVGESLYRIYDTLLAEEGERDENINYNRLVQACN